MGDKRFQMHNERSCVPTPKVIYAVAQPDVHGLKNLLTVHDDRSQGRHV